MRPPIETARLEEARITTALTEIAKHSAPGLGGTMLYDSPGSWANTTIGIPFDINPTDDDILALIDHYAQRNCEADISITAFHSQQLLNALARHNFTLREIVNVLACETNEPRNTAPPVPGLTLEEVDKSSEAALEAFALIATSGFIKPGADPMQHVPLAMTAARHPRTTSFIAKIHGEPAGAGSMELHDEVAALWGVTVLEPFRKRGVQRALIDHRLNIAQAQGRSLATISSKPGIPTERNAARAGFHLAYAQVVLARSGEGLIPRSM